MSHQTEIIIERINQSSYDKAKKEYQIKVRDKSLRNVFLVANKKTMTYFVAFFSEEYIKSYSSFEIIN